MYAVIQTGGKQYLVKTGDEIIVDKIESGEGQTVSLTKLAAFDVDGSKCEVGTPHLTSPVTATILEQGKGDKIRVAKFKAKVRYRKVMGFRPMLTKLKIVSV